MTLNCTYAPDNIFAKILSGAIPSVKVYEDDRVLSFMDAFPQANGHTLVIPKVSACNLFDVSSEDLQNLIHHTQRIATALRDGLEPDGIRIAQFNGESAGQTVFHLHFHIIPVYNGNQVRAHAAGQMADLNELRGFADKIRAKL
ncbi:HIT family hydrolase [Asticcacaulis sp. AC460]|uniref:HIT family protein n=1 Tax=Asticcacaulis sp. AC460 TaxID=1282360 RepID=UPI0003C3C359|nr:HIT family protein [Asticcacaulis sp. AC460]ESQ88191.1 HIT family hydrolase [Asticcacaulis sp. AC460]